MDLSLGKAQACKETAQPDGGWLIAVVRDVLGVWEFTEMQHTAELIVAGA